MLKEDLGPQRATLFLTGEITRELAVELVDRIHKLHNTYFYPQVDLEVASPGGEAAALFYCVEALCEGRPSGLKITTRVRTMASSAAAVLVSLGDRRVASPRARLLYHTARLMGIDSEITARTATTIGRAIGEIDASLVELLMEGARRGPRTVAASEKARVTDFAATDWDVVAHLVGRGRQQGGRVRRGSLLKELRRQVAAALKAPESDELAALYTSLCVLDASISGFLAQELRLIDSIGEPAGSEPGDVDGEADRPTVRIPEWQTLFRPGGHVPRDVLCRHALILGETGSGKTASGILPLVSAILDESSPVGCALVIDPKHELGEAALQLDGTAVRVIDVRREIEPDVFDLMPGSLSIAPDLEQGRVMTAARKILCRAASLSENNPAKVLAGAASTAREPYWDMQGARLAQTVLALVLTLIDRRVAIFGTADASGALQGAPLAVRKACGELGVLAGCLQRNAQIDAIAKKALDKLGSSTAQEVVRTDFARDVRETRFYQVKHEFQEEFEALKASAPEPRTEREFAGATRDLIDAVCMAAARCPKRQHDLDLGINVLALANHALESLFPMGSGASAVGTGGDRNEKNENKILGATLAERLRTMIHGGEIGATLDAIAGYWNKLCGPHAHSHYGAIVAHARMCFYAFADEIPACTLFFGCEPGLRTPDDRFGGGPKLVDFEAVIDDEDHKRVYLFRPQLGADNETLVARALKALFFEAVLNSEKRRKHGATMPLVAYVADEFHRFVTADVVHGEQSFLDTCRSFGAFCMLACQSIASLRHALSEMAERSPSNEPAIEILLTNTGTKLFFRSTDREVLAFLERQCPVEPGRPKVTEVRPPSTLKPGECYAVLADGRFERRQLAPFGARTPVVPQAAGEPAPGR